MSVSANVAVKAISGDDYVDPLYSPFKSVVDGSIDRIRVRVKERQVEQSERKRYIHNENSVMNSRTNIPNSRPSSVSPSVKKELPISLNSPRWKTSIPNLPTTLQSCPPPRTCTLVTSFSYPIVNGRKQPTKLPRRQIHIQHQLLPAQSHPVAPTQPPLPAVPKNGPVQRKSLPTDSSPKHIGFLPPFVVLTVVVHAISAATTNPQLSDPSSPNGSENRNSSPIIFASCPVTPVTAGAPPSLQRTRGGLTRWVVIPNIIRRGIR